VPKYLAWRWIHHHSQASLRSPATWAGAMAVSICAPVLPYSTQSPPRPEIVIHMAAQTLVRASYRDPMETCAINVIGLVHVLDAVHRADSA
jgi:nucleoside-diphosphate-sugar epimerase